MKSKVLRLLEAAGLQVPHRWSDLILLHNGARIPPLLPIGGDFVWNWGFKLLIIGDDGTPTHFAKCRAAAPEVINATRLRVLLSRDAVCSDVVPLTWAAQHDELHIEISRYLGGRMYESMLADLDENAWRESMREIVAAADRVSRRIPAIETGSRTNGAPIHLRSESARALSRLATLGFSRADLDLLVSLFDVDASIDRRPQHGDLWARNIVHFDGRWWLLDFDLFGQVQVPLYDGFHLVSTSADQRARALGLPAKPWLARLCEGDRFTQPGLDVIRWLAAQEAFTTTTFVAAYVFYLVDSATRLYDRGVQRSYWEPAIESIRLALQCERNGPRLKELLTPANSGELPVAESVG